MLHLPRRKALPFLVAAARVTSAWPISASAQQAEEITVIGAPGSQDPTGVTLVGAQTDGGFGAYFIDLRNLNFDRTLVLVDGSRFVLSGIQTDEAVDLNDIPIAFVDRIEVLKDGTQPRYGPDAVAGADYCFCSEAGTQLVGVWVAARIAEPAVSIALPI